MESGLRLVEEARKKCKEMVIIANYSYVQAQIWRVGRMRPGVLMPPGAQILELNFCCPNMSFNVDVSERANKETRPSSGASMGQDEDAVRLVIENTRKVTQPPLIAKITPEGGRIAEVSRVAFEAGAARSAALPTAWEFLPSTSGTIKSPSTTFRGRTPWVAFPDPGSNLSPCGMFLRSANWSAPAPTSTARAGSPPWKTPWR